MEASRTHSTPVTNISHNDAHLMFQCAQCSRRFARVDHLTRHVRTHTRERPHRCATCGRAFARVDLLRRHALRHTNQLHGALEKPATDRRSRTAKACHACASSKLKCDDHRPCERCTKRGLTCDETHAAADRWQSNMQLSANPSDPDSPEIESNDTSSLYSQIAVYPEGTLAQGFGQSLHDSGSAANGQDSFIPAATDFSDANAATQHSNDALTMLDENGLAPYTDFLRDLLFSTPPSPTIGTPRPQRSINVALFDFWDIDCDPSWNLDGSLANVPFQDIPPIPSSDLRNFNMPVTQGSITGSSLHQVVQAAASEAFTTSVWQWLPTKSDHARAHQHDLALDAGTSSEPDSALILAPEIQAKRLQPTDRDRVLSFLLAHCERTVIVRVASAFPSCQLMERLLHVALHFQTIGTLPWIHVPTLQPHLLKDELLSMLIAYGAFLSPVPAHQNLGNAITDIIFISVPDIWAKDNAATRDPQLWQCWTIALHLMVWSGSKRKTEIGESFTQPLLTMLRRSGALSRNQYVEIEPTDQDSSSDLEAKWRAWAFQESKIRLVHHLFMHDAQTSMTLFVNPLMLTVEMTLPLPANEGLWSAATADQWRVQYLAAVLASSQRRSLAGCVRSALIQVPETTAAIPNSTQTSDVLNVYGLWGLVWDRQLLYSWLRTNDLIYDQRGALSDVRTALLLRVLDSYERQHDLHTSILPTDVLKTEMALGINYLRLALHAPLRSLPIFAGSEGQTEAQVVLPMLQEWMLTKEGRQSLWYAGQILRLARMMPQSLMQAFFAVSVYHATLTLWSFSIIWSARQRTCGLAPSPLDLSSEEHSRPVDLDGPSTYRVHDFVALANGTPTISNGRHVNQETSTSIIVLHNPSAVMQAGANILKEQARFRGNNLPRFVEKLLQLMEGLSTAAKAAGLG